MKHALLASLFMLPLSALAVDKAAFSVFGLDLRFAEVTCEGVTGYPAAHTFRLPAVEGSPDIFESYVDMIAPYKLVITASAAPDGRTLYLAFAREDATPVFASTKGLDLALRIGSGMDVYCELNDGPQITTDF